MRRFHIHNNIYLEIMDEYEKQYPMALGAEGLYDDMYEQLGLEGYEELIAQLENLDPKERAAQIQQLRAMAAANGQLPGNGFDSDDEGALFFDNNDLANRIWDDKEEGLD